MCCDVVSIHRTTNHGLGHVWLDGGVEPVSFINCLEKGFLTVPITRIYIYMCKSIKSATQVIISMSLWIHSLEMHWCHWNLEFETCHTPSDTLVITSARHSCMSYPWRGRISFDIMLSMSDRCTTKLTAKMFYMRASNCNCNKYWWQTKHEIRFGTRHVYVEPPTQAALLKYIPHLMFIFSL